MPKHCVRLMEHEETDGNRIRLELSIIRDPDDAFIGETEVADVRDGVLYALDGGVEGLKVARKP